MSRDDPPEDDASEYDDLGPNGGLGGAGDDLAPAGLEAVSLADLDPGPLVTGAFVGLAGLLFLLQPVVPFVELGALRVRPVALSALALAVGLWVGAAVYLRRGKRLVGGAHGVGAVGWSGIVLGTAAGNGTVLLGAIVVLVVGMVALAVESRRYT
ncbi:hypothetical protein [Haloglomus litoreum]|uniref:hypothetical protein n=1 Tax=Haloglomus litoreum TaxID=3034026 RepID=UPI0023E8D551|nr:hypothetical protein [Haloglomus sp. DT116]